jgi:mRNA interferase RelE/StbE
VSFAVVWEPDAINLATGFLADDPEGLRTLFEAVDALMEEPRPPQAFPFGTSGLNRLRVGRYRVVYETDDASRTIKIRHVGRRARSS